MLTDTINIGGAEESLKAVEKANNYQKLATYDQESGGLELLLLSLFTLGRYQVTWC